MTTMTIDQFRVHVHAHAHAHVRAFEYYASFYHEMFVALKY
jgi:hypothetical protein